jgi:hypothetical protein
MNVRYNSNLAFVDLLFNLILGFAFLFIVAFFLINDPTEDKDVEAKVEYMIIMDWDGDRDIDMDLWVQSPSGLVGFRSPNIGYVNLDRDDLGHRNDSIINKTTKRREIVKLNREVINVRGFQSGEYTVNAHWFFTRGEQNPRPLEVNVQVIKLNPYKEVYIGTKKFAWKGQEQTFTRFSMKEDGDYWKMNDLPKNLVLRPSSGSSSSDPGVFSSYSSSGGPSGSATIPRGSGASRQSQYDDDEGNP